MDYNAAPSFDISTFISPIEILGRPADNWTPLTIVQDLGVAARPTVLTEFKRREAAPTPLIHATEQDSSVRSADVDRVARQRVAVIIRKHSEKNVPGELLARLELLNRRLASMAPRVTSNQVAALEATQRRLEDLTVSHAARMERIRGLAASRK